MRIFLINLLVGTIFIYSEINAQNSDHKRHRKRMNIETVMIPNLGIRMGKYEVTFDQYDAYCDATGAERPSDQGWGRGNRPVINVNWDDARKFCEWLSEKTGQNWSLPIESEWLYAARGGSASWYSGSPYLNEVGWYTDNSGNKTHPVGEKKPNGYGLYDMSGNVSEWCLDQSSYTYRVTWGGSFYSSESDCRVNKQYFARSGDNHQSYRHYDIGFRVVLVPPKQPRIGTEIETVVMPRYSSIRMGKYEVSFDQYDDYCDATGAKKPSDKGWGRGSRPVINVSLDDANKFCDWLSKETRQKWCLPTGDQWEYAAKGMEDYTYAGSNDLSEVAWYSDNSGHQTHPVGEKKPNAYGIYDMSGNISEWCRREYYPSRGEAHGGSWIDKPERCKVTEKAGADTKEGRVWIGFRVVLVPWF